MIWLATFGRLPVAVAADEVCSPHLLEERLDPLERRLGPPTMMVSEALGADLAARDRRVEIVAADSLMAAANFFVSIGEIELMSTTSCPWARPLAIPSGSNSTDFTSGVSEP